MAGTVSRSTGSIRPARRRSRPRAWWPLDGLELLDFARAIKSADEIKAMCDAIRACEEGMRRMQAAHRPGITEQALWSVLCQANAELGGEWMETRLLSAGARTNPWYNECGDYVIQPGDLVSFDTDLVGRHGYSVDLSRSWLTDGARATDAQRRLYALAHAQVHHNIGILAARPHAFARSPTPRTGCPRSSCRG